MTKAAGHPNAASAPEGALLHLLQTLESLHYDFIAPTPATHARVCARKGRARNLRDVFGWSLPFTADVIGLQLSRSLREAGLLDIDGEVLRSRVRVSRLADQLFLHSAYPTDDKDAVFLGPDSYRFGRLICASLQGRPPPRMIVDLGAGAGVGGLVAGALFPEARVVMTEVNRKALGLATVNAAHAGRRVETMIVDAGAHPLQDIDLALANPPFMLDPCDRAYRNGGGMHGAQLSLDWTLHTAGRLAQGGRMILYTGSAIVEGRDELLQALTDTLPDLGCHLSYEQLDPDIFGEDLGQPGYQDVERIAAIGAVITRVSQASSIPSRSNGSITASTPPSARPGGTCSDTPTASTRPADRHSALPISARPGWNAERQNSLHLLGGGSRS